MTHLYTFDRCHVSRMMYYSHIIDTQCVGAIGHIIRHVNDARLTLMMCHVWCVSRTHIIRHIISRLLAMTQSCVCHDSFICVTGLVHTCARGICHDPIMCVTRLIHMCDRTRSYVWRVRLPWLNHVCDMTHSYVWQDTFIRVTCMATCHDSIMCVTWLIYMCDRTHLYVYVYGGECV